MSIEDMARKQAAIYAEGEALKAEMADGEPTDEQRTKLRALAEEYTNLQGQMEEAAKDDENFAVLRAGKDAEASIRASKEQNRLPIYGEPRKDEEPESLTLGESFVRSQAYRSLMEMYPGDRKLPPNFQSPSVTVNMPLTANPTQQARMRTLITSNDASAGDLVRPLYRGLLEPGLWAPRGLTSLLTRVPVTTDTIEYTVEVSHERSADWVDEATAATGTSGTKPEGGLVFNVVSDSVYTMAVWTPATKRILADANGLAAYIDAYLRNDIEDKLEDEILNGSGGSAFLGIMNASIQTQAAGTGPFYALRSAKTKLMTIGRVRPTAIIANPTNVEEWDLAEVNSETNRFVAAPNAPFSGGTQRIWGVPVIESEFIDEGHALIGDFRFGVLFDREDVSVSVGTINDDFIRNIVRMLAEGRWGFGVIRPNAFVDVTV